MPLTEFVEFRARQMACQVHLSTVDNEFRSILAPLAHQHTQQGYSVSGQSNNKEEGSVISQIQNALVKTVPPRVITWQYN